MGHVQAKAMFGGYGIYKDNLMFALVADNTLYLKVDDDNKDDFVSRQLSPFTYSKKGKAFSMSYYLAPEETIDDSAELCQWAEKSLAAAVRA